MSPESFSFLFLMDPYPGYNLTHDTSHLLMHEAWSRGHRVDYGDAFRLSWGQGRMMAMVHRVKEVFLGDPYFAFDEETQPALLFYDLILMRRDPPYDLSYLYATQLLLQAKPRVCNNPEILATLNEKLIILTWSQWIPPTLVTAGIHELAPFAAQHGHDLMIKDLSPFFLSTGGRAPHTILLFFFFSFLYH